jgi:hypothetical protein
MKLPPEMLVAAYRQIYILTLQHYIQTSQLNYELCNNILENKNYYKRIINLKILR